jgi:hypothetical protein
MSVCVCVRIDFEPYEMDTPGGCTALTHAPSVRLQYTHMASVDLLSNPVWKQVFLLIAQLTNDLIIITLLA